jgi:pilus assembly protein CpaB
MAERRYTLVLYGAILVAALATYGTYKMISTMRAQSRVPMRSVVVAAKDVPEGMTFDRLAVRTQSWPAQAVPPGAFATTDSVVGRVARLAVFTGEPIVPGRLAPTGSGAGLETKIPQGMRAMAVRINDVAGISGLLQPNSRVDVLVTLDQGSGGTDDVAKVFMENMQVLSVGTEVQRDKDGKPIEAKTVTLGVTPVEAERLAVAMNRGQIQLVLRGYGDPDTVRTSGATSRDVLSQLSGGSAPVRVANPPVRRVTRLITTPRVPVAAPPPPPEPEIVNVDVYRGDKTSHQTFEKTTGAPTRKAP